MNITTKQYALSKNRCTSGVTKAIRENRSLPDVIKYYKAGRDYILKVKKDFVLTK